MITEDYMINMIYGDNKINVILILYNNIISRDYMKNMISGDNMMHMISGDYMLNMISGDYMMHMISGDYMINMISGGICPCSGPWKLGSSRRLR
jgi:hypothetical protein